jgi:hypothetical protein
VDRAPSISVIATTVDRLDEQAVIALLMFDHPPEIA